VSDDRDKALLLAFCNFVDDTEPPYYMQNMGRMIDAFLAARQPQAEACDDDYPYCAKHNIADCAECHGGSSPEMPPAPQAAIQETGPKLEQGAVLGSHVQGALNTPPAPLEQMAEEWRKDAEAMESSLRQARESALLHASRNVVLEADLARVTAERDKLEASMRRLTERNVEVRLQRDALLAAARGVLATQSEPPFSASALDTIDAAWSALRGAVAACK